MKKVSTTAAKQSRNFSGQKLTIGSDLGDRASWVSRSSKPAIRTLPPNFCVPPWWLQLAKNRRKLTPKRKTCPNPL